jgi:uncharacterized protein
MIERLLAQFLYHPVVLHRQAPPPSYAQGASEVFVETDLGDEIHGLYWPAPANRPTILFFHGNAQSVFEWALIAPELAPLECGLLLIDYPGYGKSSGKPHEKALFAAGRASLAWLTNQGIPAKMVLVFGKSLGGPVALHTASQQEVLGVILESTFRSLPNVISRIVPALPTSLIRTERYDSTSILAGLAAPILVVHGDRDELIPFSEGQALFAEAREPKEMYVVTNGGHNDVSMAAGREYGRRLRRWLDGVFQ